MSTGGLPASPPIGSEVTDLDAILIGHVAGVYPAPDSTVGQWAAVDLGQAQRVVLVPLAEAITVFGGIQLPYRLAQLQHAPAAPVGPALGDADVNTAADFYTSAADPNATTEGTDLVIIRSEEQLRARTETVPVRRVRFRKYVVTEDRTITVQLRREELRMEEEAITDPATATPPPAEVADSANLLLGPGDDREAVILLYAEQPIVTTEVIPTERIRVSKYLVTEQQSVSGTVAREVLDIDEFVEPTDLDPSPRS